MKYYLLDFNDLVHGEGGEFTLSAITCMNEDEYKAWLETPAGKLNDKYELEMFEYNDSVVRSEHYLKEYNEKFGNKYEWNLNEQELAWVHKNRYFIKPVPIKIVSYIKTCEYMDVSYNPIYKELHLMKEFVEEGYVTVKEIPKEFYDIFKEYNLHEVSSMNIFEIKAVEEIPQGQVPVAIANDFEALPPVAGSSDFYDEMKHGWVDPSPHAQEYKDDDYEIGETDDQLAW